MSDNTKQFSLQNFRPNGFVFPSGLTENNVTSVEYVVVAGGGGGGQSQTGGGGGGAGGFQTGTLAINVNQDYSITVGAGGPGIAADTFGDGSVGSNSVFSSVTAFRGGGGGGGWRRR